MKNIPIERYPYLAKDVANAPVIKLAGGKYRFHIFSIGERGTKLEPELISEVVDGLLEKVKPYIKDLDYIVTIEPGGNQWAVAVAHELKIPLIVFRERSSGLGDETKVYQNTLLYRRNLYLRGVRSGDKVVVLDDVVSTGGTIRMIISALKKQGAEIKGVFCIITKGEAYKSIEKKEKVSVEWLINVESH